MNDSTLIDCRSSKEPSRIQSPKSLDETNRQVRHPWLLASQSRRQNIVAGNSNQSLKDKNRCVAIARRSALESATIPDVLQIFNAMNEDANCRGGTDLKWTMSTLARWIQQPNEVSVDRIEYQPNMEPCRTIGCTEVGKRCVVPRERSSRRLGDPDRKTPCRPASGRPNCYPFGSMQYRIGINNRQKARCGGRVPQDQAVFS
jgi:hypothetical protein